MQKRQLAQQLKQFNFRDILIDLGWDADVHMRERWKFGIDEFEIASVVHKRGFTVFTAENKSTGRMPDYALRRRIENQVTKIVREHIIIFIDNAHSHQIWQWTKREKGKPIRVSEQSFQTSQSGEALIQKLNGIAFTLQEEEALTLPDVIERTESQYTERVTKTFYAQFKTEHETFLNFIKGIKSKVDQEWYASLMLNRLMFIYFIQRKGFLDGNPGYLEDRLKKVQELKGKDKFFKSFYKSFLRQLFHKALGTPEADRDLDSQMKELIGDVPYLNGGLFDEHALERDYDPNIPDEAFETLFKFFSRWQWHLDDRPLKNDNEINPDVIGYIFEKYVNQKQMGAYYTKEDITEYISKNTIIPYLFDRIKEKQKKEFGAEGFVWQLLRNDPDKYIYDSVKHGCYRDDGTEQPLPQNIAAGLADITKRTDWNKLAPPEYALPTEIWREVIDRRRRYADVKKKIAANEISSINDFITHNLDITQFAEDVIANAEDSEFVNQFYKAVYDIKVLDPTCGSGAFLFAALNILEPLYEGCLERMKRFVEELDLAPAKHRADKFKQFKEILDDVNRHPNTTYFIYKKIILHNLYGVDIMNEAVEIAKLRLFLKLVALVENKNQIEPLPDIDFNIRAGNTLVGFATEDEVKKTGLAWSLIPDEDLTEINHKAADVATAYNYFKSEQLLAEKTDSNFKKAKKQLAERLAVLNEKLNQFLAKSYPPQKKSDAQYKKWLDSYKPFHWYVQYNDIMRNGGFDVIIGNPPYVEYSKVKKSYEVRNIATLSCGNIYSFIIERCILLLRDNGWFSMIVQNSIVCTKRMYPIQKLLREKFDLYLSNFDDRPAKLFSGLNHMKGTIFLSAPIKRKSIYSTKFYRWHDEFRGQLFENISYSEIPTEFIFQGHIPKLFSNLSNSILSKLYKQPQLLLALTKQGKTVYCHRIASYFIKALDFVPYFYNEQDGERKSEDYKEYQVATDEEAKILTALLNSNVFYLHWHFFHDGYHCGKANIEEFPFKNSDERKIRNRLMKLGTNISTDYAQNSQRRHTSYDNTGIVIYDEFYPKFSKPIIDEIDRVLAQHYGFTDEELDFIINYDIKYRMGLVKGKGEEESEEEIEVEEEN